MIRVLILLTAVITSLPTEGQSTDSLLSRVLSPREMLEDLTTYTSLLQETHPGLYRYQSEEEFASTIDEIKSQIQNPLPFYSYFKLLAGLTAEIRCAHTSIYPKRDIMSYVNSSCKMFPFFMYPTENKLYVLFSGIDGDTIKPGYELVSINGRTIDDIVEVIRTYYSMDGHPVSIPKKYLQGGYFCLYYYLFVEQPEVFDLEFKDLSGNIVKINTPGKPYSKVDKMYFSNPINKQMLSFYNKKMKNWGFKIVGEVPSTAQIHFNGFGGKGMDSEPEAQKAMQEFMDKAMKKIQQKKITNLIIELRGNFGGWDIQGKELFSYFFKGNEAKLYYRDQYAVTIDSEFLDYSDVSEEDKERARPFLLPQPDGSYKLDPKGNTTLLPQQPKPTRFEGNVYILVNEYCSSSCAEFSAVAKSNGIGVIVGTETGGAYEGGNGGSFINYDLPNTGIASNSPLVRYNMAVNPAESPGRGTIPDHLIEFTPEDILTGRDAQKEFVYDLIRESSGDRN